MVCRSHVVTRHAVADVSCGTSWSRDRFDRSAYFVGPFIGVAHRVLYVPCRPLDARVRDELVRELVAAARSTCTHVRALASHRVVRRSRSFVCRVKKPVPNRGDRVSIVVRPFGIAGWWRVQFTHTTHTHTTPSAPPAKKDFVPPLPHARIFASEYRQIYLGNRFFAMRTTGVSWSRFGRVSARILSLLSRRTISHSASALVSLSIAKMLQFYVGSRRFVMCTRAFQSLHFVRMCEMSQGGGTTGGGGEGFRTSGGVCILSALHAATAAIRVLWKITRRVTNIAVIVERT